MNRQKELDRHFRKNINFRDLGAYTGADGRRIKPGLLYRSGGLYFMNEEELAFFQTLGVRYVMDLRTRAEAEAQPDPVLDGITYLQHSGLEFSTAKEIDFSPAGMSKIGAEGEEQLKKLHFYYRTLPFDNEAFRILFAELMQEHVPLVFHCATGKDRTGAFAILLLLALGVDRDTVLKDYLLSREYFAEMLQEGLRQDAEKIKSHPELEELITMRLGVSPKVGEMVMNEIFTRYPDPDVLMREEYDIDAEALRALYLE